MALTIALATPAITQREGTISAGFKDEYSTVCGVRLHYVKGGSGPLVFLVHGFGQNWYKWHALMPVLAKNFTVVAVDLPRLGLPDRPKGNFTAQNASSYLYEIAKKLCPTDAIPLNRNIKGGPPPMLLKDAGHFVQEWGVPVAEAAIRSFGAA